MGAPHPHAHSEPPSDESPSLFLKLIKNSLPLRLASGWVTSKVCFVGVCVVCEIWLFNHRYCCGEAVRCPCLVMSLLFIASVFMLQHLGEVTALKQPGPNDLGPCASVS
uniref:Uncharacterized protein n=1 Tax=Astatotilapia calliptera TaxID=8154 RepID=A0A3P8NT45_ASTCA